MKTTMDVELDISNVLATLKHALTLVTICSRLLPSKYYDACVEHDSDFSLADKIQNRIVNGIAAIMLGFIDNHDFFVSQDLICEGIDYCI